MQIQWLIADVHHGLLHREESGLKVPQLDQVLIPFTRAGRAVQAEQAEHAQMGQAELQAALSYAASQQGLPGFQPLLELSKVQQELQHARQSNQALERYRTPCDLIQHGDFEGSSLLGLSLGGVAFSCYISCIQHLECEGDGYA